MKHIPRRALAIAMIGLFAAGPARAAVLEKSCLPQRTGDLAALLANQTIAGRADREKMLPATRTTPRWMAAFNAVLAWSNDDCEAFSAFAEKMGYQAFELRDAKTGRKSWVVLEESAGKDAKDAGPRRYNGIFVLRAPKEAANARRLVLTAPLPSRDGNLPGIPGISDGYAAQLYQKLDATALLLSTAERCNLANCSGCAAVPNYSCGGCARTSDATHSVDNMLFAVFTALEATRTHDGAKPFWHFEFQHGKTAAPPSCSGFAKLSQGSITVRRDVPSDPPGRSLAERFYGALQHRLGPKCVCYDERERSCSLEETQSVLGRLVNQESPVPFDPCTQDATRKSGRYVHFEAANIPLDTVASALAEAVP